METSVQCPTLSRNWCLTIIVSLLYPWNNPAHSRAPLGARYLWQGYWTSRVVFHFIWKDFIFCSYKLPSSNAVPLNMNLAIGYVLVNTHQTNPPWNRAFAGFGRLGKFVKRLIKKRYTGTVYYMWFVPLANVKKEKCQLYAEREGTAFKCCSGQFPWNSYESASLMLTPFNKVLAVLSGPHVYLLWAGRPIWQHSYSND